jgi:hypothetical protein
MEKSNSYSNRDFYLSALILQKGYKLIGCTREKGITTFCFEGDNIDQLIKEYYRRDCLVEPISYGNSLKLLKSIIHGTDTDTDTNRMNNNGTHKQ